MFDAALCCFVKCKVFKTETECSSEIVSEGLHDSVLASEALNSAQSRLDYEMSRTLASRSCVTAQLLGRSAGDNCDG